MPLSTEALYEKALAMSANVEDNFLDLGRALRQLLEREPELFHQLIDKSDLGRRKAYYLVEVSRIFDPLPISRARLRKLGWTKLQIIGRKVNKDNVEELVEAAEGHTAKQLERIMREEKPLTNARCVLMYFTPKQYAELEEALVKHGASRAGRGLQDKEKALINVLRKAMPGLEQVQPAKEKPTHEPPDGAN